MTIEQLKELAYQFDGGLGDTEDVIAFFNEYSTDEEDLRDARKCRDFCLDKIQEIKENL